MRLTLCWCLTWLAAIGLQRSPLATTADLVQAMQERYAKTWYHTATFVQKTTAFAADGTTTVSTWYEALTVPGSLRIDYTPVADGNGLLFTNDTLYSFKAGKLDSTRPLVHPLMLLGFDIYLLPADDVMKKLADLKIDLSILRTDTWQGRPSYVVGAKAGDLHSPQFWIDQEHLYFTRLIRPTGAGGAQTSETQFNKYRRLGGGWMAPDVVFMVDGQTRTTEEYSDVQGDPKLDSRLFDPKFWMIVHWKQ